MRRMGRFGESKELMQPTLSGEWLSNFCLAPGDISNYWRVNMKLYLILAIIVGITGATGKVAMTEQLNPQPEIARKPNPQGTKPIIIKGESPPKQSLERQLKIPQFVPLKLEPSQQLPSDRLLNRTFRF